MIDQLINAIIAGVLGMVGFVVVQGLLDSLTTTTWGALSRAIVPLIPPVIAILVVIGMFLLLVKIRTTSAA